MGRISNAEGRLQRRFPIAALVMMIVNPLRGGALLKLFSTHPPVEERIARLEALRLRG